MSVPEYIRKVERPKNTVVVDSGVDALYRYAVRKRKQSVCKKGKNPSPRNGAVIGHIIDGKYVPLVKKKDNMPTSLSYGSSLFFHSLCGDILEDLLQIYDAKYCYSIIAMAAIKIMKPRIAISRYARYYESSYLSKYYPNTCLSKNHISSLLNYLGKYGDDRIRFYQKRIEKVTKNHHIVIDGTLKQDNSYVNDLSHYSRKSRVKGTKDISLIYAYDIELKEPICAKVFPGNEIDASSYENFIRDNKITKGIIITDKGFPPSKIRKILENDADLHFLTPIRRSNSLIIEYDMLSYAGKLEGFDDLILYKKVRTKDGRYLYSFMNQKNEAQEEKEYLRHNTYNHDEYKERKEQFGTIVFESDIDLSPEVIYKGYQQRWLIELVFRQYKNDIELTSTNVHSDYSVYGSEFINFISSIISCRMLNKAIDNNLLDKDSFGDIIEDLNEIWRKENAPEDATIQDTYWDHSLPSDLQILVKLGLIKDTSVKRPRGRPKIKQIEDKIKRPRGRPRKVIL